MPQMTEEGLNGNQTWVDQKKVQCT